MRTITYTLVFATASALAAGCESDGPNSPDRPAASVVSPDTNAGFGGSGGVNGMYDQPGQATPDGTSGRFGSSGIISGGNDGQTESTFRPGSPALSPGSTFNGGSASGTGAGAGR
jgi:hypothetical protein